ncbi:MAG: hypothetical protein J1F65_00035 [Clostridiales bacterium]|nr:hypothetical protein [Clostridiales bacterium]
MENIEKILALISACLGIIITATGFLIPLVKNAKAKRTLEILNMISNEVKGFIVEAEQFVNYSGTEKKQYVITRVNQLAIENKWKFDEDVVSEKIEEMISISKSVNQREKDKRISLQTTTENNGVPTIKL